MRAGWQWFYEGPVFNFDCDLWLETPDSEDSPASYTYRVEAMTEPPEVEAERKPLRTGFPYRYNKRPTYIRVDESNGLSPTIEEEILDRIWLYLLLGVAEVEDIVDTLAHDYEGTIEPELIEKLFYALIRARIHQQGQLKEGEPTTP